MPSTLQGRHQAAGSPQRAVCQRRGTETLRDGSVGSGGLGRGGLSKRWRGAGRGGGPKARPFSEIECRLPGHAHQEVEFHVSCLLAGEGTGFLLFQLDRCLSSLRQVNRRECASGRFSPTGDSALSYRNARLFALSDPSGSTEFRAKRAVVWGEGGWVGCCITVNPREAAAACTDTTGILFRGSVERTRVLISSDTHNCRRSMQANRKNTATGEEALVSGSPCADLHRGRLRVIETLATHTQKTSLLT